MYFFNCLVLAQFQLVQPLLQLIEPEENAAILAEQLPAEPAVATTNEANNAEPNCQPPIHKQ